jgi:hypothetical protein
MTKQQQQPITPPPELVSKWCYEDGEEIKSSPRWFVSVCAKAAQWGADTELEACCEWLSVPCPSYGRELRNARRPKPQSLKDRLTGALQNEDIGTALRLVEQLDD